MSKTWADVGQAVTARRHELGLTQQAASSLSEVSLSTWQKLEARSTAPAARSLRKMAAALGWPADFAEQILSGADTVNGEAASDAAGPYVDALAERVTAMERRERALQTTVADLLDDVLTLDLAVTSVIESLSTLRHGDFVPPEPVESIAARHARRAIALLSDEERRSIARDLFPTKR